MTTHASDQRYVVRSWDYLSGGVISVNEGDRIVRVHPNMPRWIVDISMQRQTESTSGPRRAFVLSVTDRCNIRCDFCCHPFMNSAIDEQDCVRMVGEACRLLFDEICVTGGEPYTRRPLVYRLASLCRDNGRLFGSITNGFWAKDRDRAFRLASEMVDRGVARVTFSWDPSHGEFIDPSTVQNGVDACMEAGMRVCLTGSFKTLEERHADYGIDVSEYEQYNNFTLVRSLVAPAGRGKELTDLTRPPAMNQTVEAMVCPSRHIQELVVYARDGLAQPCCSIYAGYDMPELRIGDWRRQSVAGLLDAQQGDGYFRVISDGGFALLYELLQDRAPDIAARLPDPAAALSVCQLCESVMTGPDARRIREICNAYVTEQLNATILRNAGLLASLLPTT